MYSSLVSRFVSFFISRTWICIVKFVLPSGWILKLSLILLSWIIFILLSVLLWRLLGTYMVHSRSILWLCLIGSIVVKISRLFQARSIFVLSWSRSLKGSFWWSLWGAIQLWSADLLEWFWPIHRISHLIHLLRVFLVNNILEFPLWLYALTFSRWLLLLFSHLGLLSPGRWWFKLNGLISFRIKLLRATSIILCFKALIPLRHIFLADRLVWLFKIWNNFLLFL